MDATERLFLTLAEIELRKGSGLADAARQAKFIMLNDMPEFVATLAEVKAAGEVKPEPEPKPQKPSKKTKGDEIDIEASLEPTAE
jgi:hypothetical protein